MSGTLCPKRPLYSREIRPRLGMYCCTLTVILAACVSPATAAEPPGGFTPADAVKRMKPADGLVVKLFAAEPDVRQPIFVKCDDRGRVWTISICSTRIRTA